MSENQDDRSGGETGEFGQNPPSAPVLVQREKRNRAIDSALDQREIPASLGDRIIDRSEWRPMSPLSIRLGVSGRKMRTAIAGLPKPPKTIEAFDARGNPRIHYHLSDGGRALEHKFLNRGKIPEKPDLPAVDEKGFYTDKADRKWCTTRAFYESLTDEEKERTSEVAIRRRAGKKLTSIEGIDRIGRTGCHLFLFDELANLSVVVQERKVGPDGIYTDPDTKKEWASLNTWEKIFRVSQKAMTNGIEETFGGMDKMSRLSVFNSDNREDKMFSKDELEVALAYILDADNVEINEVSTAVTEVAGEIRESIRITADEFASIVPVDVISRKQLQRKASAHMIKGPNRHGGREKDLFSVEAIIATFRSEIADLLAAIEKADEDDEVTDDKGRWITISKFLNERRGANENIENPRRLIANTDQAQRIRRMNSQNELTYLYLESDLQKAQLALKAA